MLFVAAKIDLLEQNHVLAQDPILRTLEQHWLYSCRKRDTSSLVFIWFVQIWILKLIVRPTRFEFIMQPSTEIRKLFMVHKLWVKSLLTYRSEALWCLVSESCCGRQRECRRQGFLSHCTHTCISEAKREICCFFYTFPSIFQGRWLLWVLSTYSFVYVLYLKVSKFRAIYKDTTCLDSTPRFKP